jgi:hypothetical protein
MFAQTEYFKYYAALQRLSRADNSTALSAEEEKIKYGNKEQDFLTGIFFFFERINFRHTHLQASMLQCRALKRVQT